MNIAALIATVRQSGHPLFNALDQLPIDHILCHPCPTSDRHNGSRRGCADLSSPARSRVVQVMVRTDYLPKRSGGRRSAART